MWDRSSRDSLRTMQGGGRGGARVMSVGRAGQWQGRVRSLGCIMGNETNMSHGGSLCRRLYTISSLRKYISKKYKYE